MDFQSLKNNSLNMDCDILNLFLQIVSDNQSQTNSQQADSLSLELEDSAGTNSLLLSSELKDNYSKVKKSNIVKNILKSFQRYIECSKGSDQDEFFFLYQKRYDFSQLKKLINRSIRKFGKRWNMKLRYLVEKCPYKDLFEFYLENKSSEWLDKSKVQNKEDHKIVINFTIQALKNPQYSNEIKYYRKPKCISREDK